MSKSSAQRFVGVDGEGIDNRYVLVQDSQGGEICRLDGLSTEALFNWFMSRLNALHEINPCFVGYVTSYDVNMILRDVDDDTLRAVFQTDDKTFVQWRAWEFLYIPRKVFKLRRNGDTFTLYDVFTFFGTSFVKACEGMLGDVPRIIHEGKAERTTFKRADLARIKRYNAAECQYLVKLCERLREILQSQDINIKKWHGPGAVAEYVLGKRGINLHTEYPIYSDDHVPSGLGEAWDCAYYGGRFECIGIGSFRNVFTFDINSAYPYALSRLTTLDFAVRWKRAFNPRHVRHGSHAAYLCEWDIPRDAPFGPFPWRDKQGRIFYPLNGRGWHWASEVRAARAMFGNAIKLREVWYQPEGERSVLQSEIPRLYNRRCELKAQNNRGEYALKIALNSIYGKLAQRVGMSPFRCVPWAGEITAQTRAMLLDAARERPHDVISFATDSIVSRVNLGVNSGNALGGWKSERHAQLLSLMNGFYRLGNRTESKSALRGIGLDFDWNDAIPSLNRSQSYEYKTRAFVTHSMALHFPYKFGPERLRFVSLTKRIVPFGNSRREFERNQIKNWERDRVLSRPLKFATLQESYPSSFQSATIIEEAEED